jgi:hypothetical protein
MIITGTGMPENLTLDGFMYAWVVMDIEDLNRALVSVAWTIVGPGGNSITITGDWWWDYTGTPRPIVIRAVDNKIVDNKELTAVHLWLCYYSLGFYPWMYEAVENMILMYENLERYIDNSRVIYWLSDYEHPVFGMLKVYAEYVRISVPDVYIESTKYYDNACGLLISAVTTIKCGETTYFSTWKLIDTDVQLSIVKTPLQEKVEEIGKVSLIPGITMVVLGSIIGGGLGVLKRK